MESTAALFVLDGFVELELGLSEGVPELHA
jgi:hypothetical protein